MQKSIFLSLFSVLSVTMLWSQAPFTISGIVSDPQGIPLEGVAIHTSDGVGVFSNENGYFSISVPEGDEMTLNAKLIGYDPIVRTIRRETKMPVTLTLFPAIYSLQTISMVGSWTNEKMPFTSTIIRKTTLNMLNQGQDLPWLLRLAPGVVSTSDAGNGIGYTGIRIRGADPTRTNVTINGVPVNDSESQAVFWVNMPDLVSSIDQVQIQRGAGTSSNGAGAFGATINLITDKETYEPYTVLTLGGGSFGTNRYGVRLGTGRLGNGWNIEGRYSRILSDGYIDRASSNLESMHGTVRWTGKKSIFRANLFGGKETTYQSWWGTPESRLNNDIDGMLEHASNNGLDDMQTKNLLSSGRTYNYYEYPNEVDHYKQYHAHLHWTQMLNAHWDVTLTGHYTRGTGYFEQFRKSDEFSRYGVPEPIIGGDTIRHTALIRRRWLSNHFYGMIGHAKFSKSEWEVQVGGGWNRYDGDHFGRIIWAEHAVHFPLDYEYYKGIGHKEDANLYLKVQKFFLNRWSAFIDVQGRYIDYQTSGRDNDLRPYDIQVSYPFFNPKAGITFDPKAGRQYYISAAVVHREPTRSDMIDAQSGRQPMPERMLDLEIGSKWKFNTGNIHLNGYWMRYWDQLVPTGALNDVGAAILTNINKSYRGGFELTGEFHLTPSLDVQANVSWNKTGIAEITEILYDYTHGYEEVQRVLSKVPIAYSPEWIASHLLAWRPADQWEISWISKYVSRQFLDNTGSRDRMLKGWWVHDLNASWSWEKGKYCQLQVTGQINNLFNLNYSSHGYTWSYIYERRITENFYYPQAGRHYSIGLVIRFS